MKFYLLSVLIFVTLNCFSQRKITETITYNLNQPTKTNRTNKNSEKVNSLNIFNYSDTIFPNEDILRYKNIKHIVVYARPMRLKKTDALSSPVKVKFDTLGLNQLKNLESLNLCQFDFSTFPKEIFVLQNLRKLDIGICFIKEIPPEIKKLSKLNELRLRLNEIKTLPDEIQELNSLKILDLANNSLMKIPENILLNKNIEKINLANSESYKPYNIGWYFPLEINLNKISFSNEFELLKEILKSNNIKDLRIFVKDCDEQKDIKSKISDKKLIKKIQWEKSESCY